MLSVKHYSWFLPIAVCIFISAVPFLGVGVFSCFFLFGLGFFCCFVLFFNCQNKHHVFTCIIYTIYNLCKLRGKAIHWGSGWQVMVDRKQKNWGFRGGREGEEKHSCSWGRACPGGWEGVTMARGLRWEGCRWEDGFWALVPVAMSWMARTLVLHSLGAAKGGLLGAVRLFFCQFWFIDVPCSFTIRMVWVRCVLLVREMAKLFLLLHLLLPPSSWLCFLGPVCWFSRKPAHLPPSPASPSAPHVDAPTSPFAR